MTDGRLITAGALAALILGKIKKGSKAYNQPMIPGFQTYTSPPNIIVGILEDPSFSELDPELILKDLHWDQPRVWWDYLSYPAEACFLVGIDISQNWPGGKFNDKWHFGEPRVHPFGEKYAPMDINRSIKRTANMVPEIAFVMSLKGVYPQERIRSAIVGIISSEGWGLGDFLRHFGGSIMTKLSAAELDLILDVEVLKNNDVEQEILWDWIDRYRGIDYEDEYARYSAEKYEVFYDMWSDLINHPDDYGWRIEDPDFNFIDIKYTVYMILPNDYEISGDEWPYLGEHPFEDIIRARTEVCLGVLAIEDEGDEPIDLGSFAKYADACPSAYYRQIHPNKWAVDNGEYVCNFIRDHIILRLEKKIVEVKR